MEIKMNKIPTVEKDQVVVIHMPGRYDQERLDTRIRLLKEKIYDRDKVNVDVYIEIGADIANIMVIGKMEYQKMLGEARFQNPPSEPKTLSEVFEEEGLFEDVEDLNFNLDEEKDEHPDEE